jgi:hypothetical protein
LEELHANQNIRDHNGMLPSELSDLWANYTVQLFSYVMFLSTNEDVFIRQ